MKEDAMLPATSRDLYTYSDRCLHVPDEASYGHTCGRPVEWIGVRRDGRETGYCDRCRDLLREDGRFAAWQPIFRDLAPGYWTVRHDPVTCVACRASLDAESLAYVIPSRNDPDRGVICCEDCTHRYGLARLRPRAVPPHVQKLLARPGVVRVIEYCDGWTVGDPLHGRPTGRAICYDRWPGREGVRVNPLAYRRDRRDGNGPWLVAYSDALEVVRQID